MNKSGMTLIESLIAFSILMIICLSLLPLYNIMMKQQDGYQYDLKENSGEGYEWEDYQELIQMVLP